ncbi:hemin-degrading factor [Burkholderia perseverans]|uniref:hemin-degrading factor n=1 Tax=Burkholderia perseverans TaxID=2615214 RepID=UPI001FEF11F9|nr:ChuX/HutX family heme-like substrate-binding protein [Burkholderia perseverans]
MATPSTLAPRRDAAALAALRRDFTRLRTERRLRHRDAAAALGVSEGEALAAFVGERVVRLDARFVELYEALPRLGNVMTLTRNEAAVHEKIGRFENMSHDGTIGLALGEAIDLRIFYAKWASGFAVREAAGDGERRSLQFFDAHGTAITKVYLREDSDQAAFDALVASHAARPQVAGLAVEPAAAPAARRDDAAIDVAGLRAAWDAMQDTHEFFGMLRRFGTARLQAMRLAGTSRALPLAAGATAALLGDVAASGLPIMVFVGSAGMIQIHTGPIRKVVPMGPWLNVMDPAFNLHLRADLVDSAWAVRKPTRDGVVTSIELFDARGETIAMLFGARRPGVPELEGWRAAVARLAPAADLREEVPA